jgi:hypothetical protein
LIGKEVDLAAVRGAGLTGVGMDGEEQVRLVVVGDRGALDERDFVVFLAGQEDLETQQVREGRPEPAREGEGHVLFERTGGTPRPDLRSAVAGIDDHRPDAGRVHARLTRDGRGQGLRGGKRRTLKLDHQARRALLLESLHLLETLAEGHREEIVLAPQELDRVHDSPRQPVLLQGHVHHVAGHRHRDPTLFLLHPEGELVTCVEDHPGDVPRREGADRDPGHRGVADEEHAGGRPPLHLHPEEGSEQARERVQGHEPSSLVEEDR